MTEQDEASILRGCEYIFFWACVGCLAAMAVGLVAGLTGLVETEYKTSPMGQSILIALGLSCVSVPLGATAGLVLGFAWRRKRDRGPHP